MCPYVNTLLVLNYFLIQMGNKPNHFHQSRVQHYPLLTVLTLIDMDNNGLNYFIHYGKYSLTGYTTNRKMKARKKDIQEERVKERIKY